MPWFEMNGDNRLRECASEGCGGQVTWQLEAGGVGSDFCSGCKEEIDALANKGLSAVNDAIDRLDVRHPDNH